MAKAISSATDFLAAIAGETQTFEIEGLAVELRSLTFAEVQRLTAKHRDDAAEMAFQAVILGLVAPKLDETQLEQIRTAKPGPVMEIAKRVMEISGMAEQDGGTPLAGGGSL